MAAQWDQFSAGADYLAKGKERSLHKNLKGRLCIVSDANTTMGSGIVPELLREGAFVVAPLRDEEEVDKLQQECADVTTERLLPVIVDVTDERECALFLEETVNKHGPIDHAISVFGRFWQGGLLTEQPLAELQRVLRGTVEAHFVFAKCVLPVMKHSQSSSFMFISEGAGKQAISPESSLYSVAAAAVYGIILAAQAEFADHPLRINEMRLYAAFKRRTDVGSNNFQDFYGLKAYSNRKVGRMAVDALLASKKTERFVVTADRLDGEALTV